MRSRRICAMGLISIITLIAFSETANAIFTIPGYGDFGDHDSTSLWLPSNEVLVDGGSPNPAFGGGSFGFYFSAEPSTLITIFGPDDQADWFSFTQRARIDFDTGQVIDVDAGGVIESTFTNLGSCIGFWTALDFDSDPSTPPYMAYTSLDPSLVGPIIGIAGTFPLLSDPSTYLLLFISPEFAEYPLAAEIVAGITPAPVPEPSTLLFLGSGLAGLGGMAWRRRRK